ncbi:uncharacterized protein [Littorina saxatilis]|uniref:H-type lectin domain-containing protein n=1 Tax=Littorina saxatilis TaxID=31220 RepID=A0AAN9GEZ9_9CAEN
MAEDLTVHNTNRDETLELAICQPDHPNQALFVGDLDIFLSDFRTRISESDLFLPEAWRFMTRGGSLISAGQEANIQLNNIAREREETGVLDVMIDPSLSSPPPRRGSPNQAGSPLASFATIVAAVRDIFVNSIQPNMHELIKPLIIAAGAAAVLSFVLALVLSVSLGALGGVNRSVLVPFLRHHLCSAEIDTASHMPQLYKRINELENKMHHMRQVEVGTLVCKDDHHMYEENETTMVHVPFRKTNFSDSPRVIFGLRGLSVDDFNSVRLEDLRVNGTGFSVKCSYFGKWMHYSMEFSWVAVGQ